MSLPVHILQGTESWKPNGADLGAVAVLTGQASQEELRYLKSVSMQLWLFGYELTGVLQQFVSAEQSGRLAC